jgi:hypothetical protein
MHITCICPCWGWSARSDDKGLAWACPSRSARHAPSPRAPIAAGKARIARPILHHPSSDRCKPRSTWAGRPLSCNHAGLHFLVQFSAAWCQRPFSAIVIDYVVINSANQCKKHGQLQPVDASVWRTNGAQPWLVFAPHSAVGREGARL